ncbi:MAG: uracil-DNA glycosylase [Planctomycetota bacterium]
MNDVLAATTYADFRAALAGSGCTKCDLAGGRTQIVVDRGDPDARLMLIGEGPGAEEDRTGRAFVGRSGRLLDRLLTEAGFDIEREILIANIVRCRPPGNRAPKVSEAKACLPYLRHQISLVDPDVIALLGASAIRFLLPDLKGRPMKDLVGRPFDHADFPGAKLLPLYHPAFLLRDPRRIPESEAWFATLRGTIGK